MYEKVSLDQVFIGGERRKVQQEFAMYLQRHLDDFCFRFNRREKLL
jgi:hypothetical protein